MNEFRITHYSHFEKPVSVFVEGGESRLFSPLLQCRPGKFFQHAVDIGGLPVLHSPSCCSPLDFFNGVGAGCCDGIPYRTSVFQARSDMGFVCCCFNIATAGLQVSPYKAQGLVCFAGYVVDVILDWRLESLTMT